MISAHWMLLAGCFLLPDKKGEDTVTGDTVVPTDDTTVPAGPDDPVLLSFDANVTVMDAGDLLTFTAIVTDPQGIVDLIGGSLNDVATAATYGPFVTTGSEGIYTISVTWDQLQTVAPIDGPAGGLAREFEAVFFDQAGNSVSGGVTIQLVCQQDAALGLCDGACTDVLTDELNCGACGNVVEVVGGICEGGEVTCTGGRTICDDVCVDLTNDLTNCGACGTVCADLTPGTYGFDWSCEDSTCRLPSTFAVRDDCTALCAGIGLSCAEDQPCGASTTGACATYNCAVDRNVAYSCNQVPAAMDGACPFLETRCSCVN